jgi:hypothetical protein
LGIRILVAFEDVYRTYRAVIAAAIKVLRPRVEVASAGLEDLEGEMAHFGPQLDISSRGKPASVPPEVSWIEVPIDAFPHGSGLLTLEELITLIDQLEET